MTVPAARGSQRLKDKVILVTGSTTGIGEAMARVFAREGAKVMVHGKTPDDGAAALAQAMGGGTAFTIGALEDPATPAKLVAETVARLGRIDGLVNNAAVIAHGGLEDTDCDKFDRTLAINLRAPFLLIQAALPHFRRQKKGRVLN